MLNFVGLSATVAIGSLTESNNIRQLEQMITAQRNKIVSYCSTNSMHLETFMPECQDETENFTFTFVDKLCISAIADCVKRNGISKYLPSLQPRTRNKHPILAKNLEPLDKDMEAQTLLARIKRHYRSW